LAPLPASPIVFDPTRKTWINTPLPNRVSYLPAGGGWLVAIGSHAKANAYDGAISFLQLLASPETAQAVVSDPAFPMTPVRTSHLALGLPDPRGALGVDTREWGKTVAATFEAPRVAVGLRIPDAEGYLQDLRGAVRAAMRGEQSPEAALQDAAKAWNRRTTELGRARQLWHYRRSLNRLSTTSTPPPKD
jgi:multiple sugar transport system substrate-binding protein